MVRNLYIAKSIISGVFIIIILMSCKMISLDKNIGNLYTGINGIELYSSDDSIYLISEPTMTFHSDLYIYKSNPFEISLPKGLVDYSIISHVFHFLYNDSQMIIINGGMSIVNDNIQDEDNRYKRESLIKEYINNEFFFNNAGSYLYKGIDREFLVKPIKNRETIIYRNGDIQIVLYNIKAEKIEILESYISTFKFL